jgi:hypothetical protein
MKTTYGEWKAYLDSWPDGQWFDDSDETIDGVSADEVSGDPRPEAVVEFTCGLVYDKEGRDFDLIRHFGKWRKAQKVDRVLCEIPKEHTDALRTFLRQHGGKLAKD